MRRRTGRFFAELLLLIRIDGKQTAKPPHSLIHQPPLLLAMKNQSSLPLLASLLATNAYWADGFALKSRPLAHLTEHNRCCNAGGALALASSSSSSADEEAAEKKGMALLKFVGEATTTTDPVPMPPSDISLADFFAVDNHRDLLMKGTGNKVEPMKSNDELMERWVVEAKRVGAVPPQKGDPLLQVTTSGIQFPGLKILSVAIIGAKLIVDGDGGYPVHEFTLVKDTIKAEGPRPIRFIFNKLTATRDEEAKEQTTHSLTRTTAKSAGGDKLVFTSSSYLEVDVAFPRVLLRILPVSKEKAEEQGSQSILKTIEKDSGPALENFKKAYSTYIRSIK